MKDEPAFPCEWAKVHHTPGMTLRDYFAAKAMQSIAVESLSESKGNAGILARNAYVIADEMLKARGTK